MLCAAYNFSHKRACHHDGKWFDGERNVWLCGYHHFREYYLATDIATYQNQNTGMPHTRHVHNIGGEVTAVDDDDDIIDVTPDGLGELGSNEECTVCFESIHIENSSGCRVKLDCCKQVFHMRCLDKWLNKSMIKRCPLCRATIYTDSLPRSITM